MGGGAERDMGGAEEPGLSAAILELIRPLKGRAKAAWRAAGTGTRSRVSSKKAPNKDTVA